MYLLFDLFREFSFQKWGSFKVVRVVRLFKLATRIPCDIGCTQLFNVVMKIDFIFIYVYFIEYLVLYAFLNSIILIIRSVKN